MIDYLSAIARIKKEKDALILAHYYQDEEIQDVADFIGDSLELAKAAMRAEQKLIVFCGVRFMAESALILNPDKIVILPDINAGCSLEEACRPKEFATFRAAHPDYIALTYINCSAHIKAMSDIIVTSSSAEKIIKQIPLNQPILFAPDRHLGAYLMKKTGREMKLWHGSCIVHENFSERELIKLTLEHPDALVIAHPECPDSLLNYAHHIGSTSSLLNFTKQNVGKKFIVLTEPGIIHQMKSYSQDSSFYYVPSTQAAGCTLCSSCPYMKLNNLEKLYNCMNNMHPKIQIEQDIMDGARKSLMKMLEMS
ncbi:Quinolinate synthase A [Rickettsiales endosymbiont of Paramecium tredecaurelia]|uniref:quinolinate synthase NadA n=1 Tax=Candidatus Sarmatiella mevalonica TaxID=2770581 RepID=UPI0019245AFE|nr:quinolinate synthase NadA [Candidatus Sarmatiella mevalonica]MBL3284370.1 Quinolinate synthase A [Candidatus Sarmatiella mevalonica]